MQGTVRGGFDTWADSDHPAREHGGQRFLRIQTGTKWAYLWLKNPAPRGATIVSATLRVYSRLDWTGTVTVTARRISDSWKAKRLNWNNKPGTTGVGVDVTTTDLAGGSALEFDVTNHVQAMVNGAPNYGWRLVTDTSNVLHVWGFDAATHHPTLEVVWSDKPSVPTSLVPSAGSVSVDKPVLQFDYSDVTGDDLVAVQVQIDPNANTSAPAFDSGAVDTTEPELDLTQTTYAGLADGASTQWRVRVKDAGGLWSDWSDWVTFSRDVKGTLTIDNPAADPDNFVWEPTPPIFWTLTGETQAAYQVRITDGDDRTKLRYDSGKVKSAETSHTLPKKWEGRRVLKDDRQYQVSVRVWDDKDREATPGDPTFAWAWRTFTVNEDATVNPVDSLAATQDGDTPWVILTFSRATAPDSFNILRDGEVIETDIDPADIFTSGTSYTWRDKGATPQEEHTYAVRAVVNGRQSPKRTATVTTAPVGIWIINPETELAACILGDDEGSWLMADQATLYDPIGSTRVVRTVTGMHGLEGSLTGTLIDGLGRSAKTQEQRLLNFKEHPDQEFQLVLADVSIPVYLGDITVAPTPLSRNGDIVKSVSFSFWQSGDLNFEPRI